MARLKTLDDLDVAGKRVLLRADLNVPMTDGRITNSMRIDKVAPTIAELTEKGAIVVVASHFGRPKGQRSDALSLAPIAGALSSALNGAPVAFAADCIGADAEDAVAALSPGQVILLENLRFHAGEEANDPEFAKSLARLGDLYVDDAFSAAHRAHASIDGVARLLPAAAGRVMEAEIKALTAALDTPARPLTAVIGGNKISTKLAVLDHLVAKVDRLVIGGAMANTFLLADGINMGASLAEPDMAETAEHVKAAAKSAGCEIALPIDAVVAQSLSAGVATETVAIGSVPADAMALDIGPKTAATYSVYLEESRTLVWNGPLGAFEVPPFDAGTSAVAQTAARLTKSGDLLSVAGGGDTVAALDAASVRNDFSYVSTAGGAFLEWLEGRELPGVAVLMGDG